MTDSLSWAYSETVSRGMLGPGNIGGAAGVWRLRFAGSGHLISEFRLFGLGAFD